MTRLNADRLRRLEPILDAVLDLPPDERELFLAQACAGDTELRSDLDSLLAADAREAGVLERSSGEYVVDLFGALRGGSENPGTPSLREGDRVGPYRIVRSIAHGGMGEVFEAERADGQFEQRVALKLIRPGLESAEIRRRFLQERRILARLHHPAIARLLDGGLTEFEQPWFAMELVEGQPITAYCDERELPIESRLELFEIVCDAVQYAHRHLIVHRDIKPSNVFVTPDGKVMLLDFGIAKLLPAAEFEITGETATEWRVLTPEYAAPEQVRGDAVTAATDVYALGVVLYQLLTGYRAHRFERSTPGEVERVVCEQMPPPPSRILSSAATFTPLDGTTDEVDLEQVSRARGTTPDRLRRALAGDLDTIVLTALRKEPERRYRSVEAFREDLRRLREKLPIEARPVSTAYRLRRFVQRQRLLLASGVLLFLVLIGGVVATAWQARRATREAERARVVKDFVVGLFDAANPAQSLGRQITAQELLEMGTRRVDSLLSDEPRTHAELLTTLGAIHYTLGDFFRAESLAVRALDRWLSFGSINSLEVAVTLMELGRARVALGNYDAADSALSAALKIRERSLGKDHDDVGQVLGGLSSIARQRGEYARAESIQIRAYELYRDRYGDDHLEVTHSIASLATLASDQGDNRRADSLYARALTIRERDLPPRHPDILLLMNNRASLLGEMGRIDESIALLNDVLARRILVQGDSHPDVAWTLEAIGNRLQDRGDFAEAESLKNVALRLTRVVQPPGSPVITRMLNNLATLNYRMERFDTAAKIQREVLVEWTASLGADHPSTLTAKQYLGAILSELGRYDEAERMIREALAARRRVRGYPHEEIGASLRTLGVLLLRTERYSEAELTLREALAVHEAATDSTHPRVAEASLALGEVLCTHGNRTEGTRHARRAVAIRESKTPGAYHVAEARRVLAACLANTTERAEAESLLVSAYAIVRDDPYKRREADRIRQALNHLRQ